MLVKNKEELIARVKYSRVFYSLYYYVGSFVLCILKHFVRPDEKLILFISLGGRNFDDSPRAIYDAMLNDDRFAECKLTWAFLHPEKYDLPRGQKVKTDTLHYYICALKARVWITNSNVERGLQFKGSNTFYFNTWHGTPIKLMGTDLSDSNKSFGTKSENHVDIMTAQGEYEADIFSRVFGISKSKFRIIGLPRNDSFAHVQYDDVRHMKEILGIPKEKTVILYAPTFREYDKTDTKQCRLNLPVNFHKWKRELGDNYVILFRAHYEVAKRMSIEDSTFIRDVSAYPCLKDLMIASDILISDYSSIFFDFSIMHKPMFCFAYDYELYQKERGLYFDIRNFLPSAETESKLLEIILSFDRDELQQKVCSFQQKYVSSYGRASINSLNIIHSKLS